MVRMTGMKRVKIVYSIGGVDANNMKEVRQIYRALTDEGKRDVVREAIVRLSPCEYALADCMMDADGPCDLRWVEFAYSFMEDTMDEDNLTQMGNSTLGVRRVTLMYGVKIDESITKVFDTPEKFADYFEDCRYEDRIEIMKSILAWGGVEASKAGMDALLAGYLLKCDRVAKTYVTEVLKNVCLKSRSEDLGTKGCVRIFYPNEEVE